MSLENNVKRIVDALESIAASAEKLANPLVVVAAPVVAAPVVAAPVVAAPVVAAPVVAAPVVAAPAPAPAPAPVNALSPEEMNTALVAEFNRIGDRAPIDAAMATYGVTSINDLPGEKQQELLAAVRAIPAAGA